MHPARSLLLFDVVKAPPEYVDKRGPSVTSSGMGSSDICTYRAVVLIVSIGASGEVIQVPLE